MLLAEKEMVIMNKNKLSCWRRILPEELIKHKTFKSNLSSTTEFQEVK